MHAYVMFLFQAAKLLERDISGSCETAVDAFHSLARYVDGQYQHIVDHMNSAAFEAKQDHIRKSRDDTEQLKKLGETTRSEFPPCSFSVRRQIQLHSSTLVLPSIDAVYSFRLSF